MLRVRWMYNTRTDHTRFLDVRAGDIENEYVNRVEQDVWKTINIDWCAEKKNLIWTPSEPARKIHRSPCVLPRNPTTNFPTSLGTLRLVYEQMWCAGCGNKLKNVSTSLENPLDDASNHGLQGDYDYDQRNLMKFEIWSLKSSKDISTAGSTTIDRLRRLKAILRSINLLFVFRAATKLASSSHNLHQCRALLVLRLLSVPSPPGLI